MKKYELLRELQFYYDINISRKERAFRGHAETYKVEVINNKSLSDSLSVSKNSTENLFDELLRDEHKYSTVYFNSLVKKVINRRYHLNDSFEY